MITTEKKVETKQVTTKSTRTVDSFRKIKGDDGVVEVKRWQEDRQVTANLQVVDNGKGGIFHRGARIA